MYIWFGGLQFKLSLAFKLTLHSSNLGSHLESGSKWPLCSHWEADRHRDCFASIIKNCEHEQIFLHTWRVSFCLVQACSPTQWSLCQQIQGLLAALGNIETSTFRNEVMHVFPRSIAASLPSLGQAASAAQKFSLNLRWWKPCFTRWESSPTASRGSPAHIFLQCV